MRVRFPYKASVLCALKIIGGSVAAFSVAVNGVSYGGCPPGTFCWSRFEMYVMRIDLWSIGVSLLALWLLLSALKGLLSELSAFELPRQGVESFVNPNFDQIRADFYWKSQYDM